MSVVNRGGGLTFGPPDPPTGRRQILANVGGGLTINGGVIVPQYSAGADPNKICEANDPRLSDARRPTGHKASHQAGGGDQIDVTGLTGLLANPQKVEVQKSGQPVGAESCLNFTGGGVSVNDEQNRVNIDIPGGVGARGTTGQLVFADVAEGGSSFLPARHGLGARNVA